jgi:ankyrin repeat protein
MTIPDQNGNTLLHFLAAGDNLAAIDVELQNGADINAQNKLRRTPLHIAYARGKLQKIANNPKLVRSFFKHPSVAYISDL